MLSDRKNHLDFWLRFWYKKDVEKSLPGGQERTGGECNMVKDLTTGQPIRVIFRFAIPLLLGFWLQQMYNLVDTSIVGRTLGAMALGGVGSVWSLNYLVLGFCNGVGTGMALPVARAFGAKDEKQVRRYVANCVWISAMVSGAVLLVILPSCRGILKLMQTPEEQFSYAFQYIFTIFCGIPAAMLYNITAGILRALGDSKTPVKFLAISVCLNVALDLVFIRAFRLGVFGAAFATVLSHLISGLSCLFYMSRNYAILKMEKDDWKLRRRETAELLNMGIPMGVQHSIAALSMVIVQRAVNGLGPMAVSAYAAGSKIFSLLTGPYNMLGTASSNFTSQNLGAKQFDRIRQGLFSCLILGGCYWMVHMLIAFFGTDYIVLLFLKAEEAAPLMELVRRHCRIEAVFGATLLIVFTCRMAVQGLGYGKLSLFAGLSELVGRLSAVLLLVPVFGFTGASLAGPMAWLLADAFLLSAFFLCLKKRRQEHERTLEAAKPVGG